MRRTAIALAAAVLGLAWLALPYGGTAPEPRRLASGSVTDVVSAPEAPAWASEAVADPVSAAEPAREPEPERERESQHAQPHPITAEHLALYRDLDLLDAAWQALHGRDFARARELLAVHRREYRRQHDDMTEGLSLLADCMEQQTPEARARAQHFYDEQTHSMLRRRMRRHCLQGSL